MLFKTYSTKLVQEFCLISVCSTSLKIYSSICCSAKSKGLLTFPKHYKSASVDDGFRNLKKALETFHDHAGSVMHKEAMLKLAATKSAATGVDAQLSSQLVSDQSHNRQTLMKLLSCIKYLVRQGLLLRGHIMKIENTLKEICISFAYFKLKTAPI